MDALAHRLLSALIALTSISAHAGEVLVGAQDLPCPSATQVTREIEARAPQEVPGLPELSIFLRQPARGRLEILLRGHDLDTGWEIAFLPRDCRELPTTVILKIDEWMQDRWLPRRERAAATPRPEPPPAPPPPAPPPERATPPFSLTGLVGVSSDPDFDRMGVAASFTLSFPIADPLGLAVFGRYDDALEGPLEAGSTARVEERFWALGAGFTGRVGLAPSSHLELLIGVAAPRYALATRGLPVDSEYIVTKFGWLASARWRYSVAPMLETVVGIEWLGLIEPIAYEVAPRLTFRPPSSHLAFQVGLGWNALETRPQCPIVDGFSPCLTFRRVKQRLGRGQRMAVAAMDDRRITPEQKEKFHAFCAEHADFVLRFLYRLLGPKNDLEDLAQEVMLIAMRQLSQGAEVPSIRPWLAGIAVKVSANARRTRWFHGLFGTTHHAEEPIDWRTPDLAIEDRDRASALQRMLGQLSEKKRIVFVLHELHEFSCVEIAEMLRCPVNTVYARLRHARAELLPLARQERGALQ